ncbi:DUF4112 domain-containing protein [Luteolibacter rhizosphaerae]|uniref:DUF4112 domain-containing protein n=1 Tax=Luteolibacter rhizosphaerae TaxID=2989719 RepID=UPI003CE4CD34
MGDVIRIPGTVIRIGLETILGLLPWPGDTVASLVGLAIRGRSAPVAHWPA